MSAPRYTIRHEHNGFARERTGYVDLADAWAEHPDLNGYDLAPAWADDDREYVTLSVPAWAVQP